MTEKLRNFRGKWIFRGIWNFRGTRNFPRKIRNSAENGIPRNFRGTENFLRGTFRGMENRFKNWRGRKRGTENESHSVCPSLVTRIEIPENYSQKSGAYNESGVYYVLQNL